MRKLQMIKGKGLERVLCSLPYCKELELSGYINGNQVLYEIGGRCESKAFNKEVVFHSHPEGRYAEVPSPADVLKFAYLSKAKMSIVVCPKSFIVIEKGRFDLGKCNLYFSVLSVSWSSGKINSQWLKLWKMALKRIGMKFKMYGRESI